MKRYRISPSLLNKFSDWLNSYELYEKFWGDCENPSMTALGFEAKQRAELLSYINREPQPLSEAADRGTCLNEIVDRLIGAIPNAGVNVEQKIGPEWVASRNGFVFHFDDELCEDLATLFRTAIPQYHLCHTYEIGRGCEIELHGYADYIFPTQIYDLKTTTKYEGERYRTNWQRQIYPLIAIDSGAMRVCDSFTFLAVEMRKRKKDGRLFGKAYEETYSFNADSARGEVLEFLTAAVLPRLDYFQDNGFIPNQNIISYE